jgi:NDP-sugar pyrophosphorylase family protein
MSNVSLQQERVPVQCVILAGGLGTRMRPITETIPKVLIPVKGEPFLNHQLRWLARHGVSEVVLSLGHMGELVESHVKSSPGFGVPVRFVHEGNALRGTAGALRLASDLGVLAEDFLVTYGDSYLPIDFAWVADAFRRSGREGLMAVFKNAGQWDSSNVVFDAEAKMIRLYDKWHRVRPASDFAHIDYGVSALKRETLTRAVAPDVKSDLAELFHALSLRGELAGLEVAQRFYEIGSPAGLTDLEGYLSSQ